MLLSQIGISEQLIKAYEKKHIHTVTDVLHTFPRAYRDYREVEDIADCIPDEYHAVKGRCMSVNVKVGGSGMKYVSVRFLSTGRQVGGEDVWFGLSLFVRNYSNYVCRNYTEQFLKRDVVVTGVVKRDPIFGYSINNAEVFLENEFKPGMNCIYPGMKGVTQKDMEEIVAHYLPMQGEVLEEEPRIRHPAEGGKG